MLEQDFIYGICHTDYKSKETKLDNDKDYLWWASYVREINLQYAYYLSKNEKHGIFIAKPFEKLSLQLPKGEDIHHGSDGQLLFLDSHGIVIRIGESKNTDPRLFLHSHLLQPLGWITSKTSSFTIALYPAIHLFENWDQNSETIHRVKDSLDKSSFGSGDVSTKNNLGYIKLSDGNDFPLCLDLNWAIAEVSRDIFQDFMFVVKTIQRSQHFKIFLTINHIQLLN